MGIPKDILSTFAKKLFDIADPSKLTSKQRTAIENLYAEGFEEGGKSNKSSTTDVSSLTSGARTTGQGFSLKTGGPLTDLLDQGKELTNAFSSDSMFKGVDDLMNKAQGLANAMGVGKARAGEFRGLIADSVPEMIKLGVSEDKVIENMQEIPKQLGVNTTLTKESIIEISSISKVTGLDAGKLANEFKNVGVNLSDVGDRMAEVANYAKSVGVNVSAVSKGVLDNIGRLNTMNFEGGIKGLTKMVTQSQMLGINMEKVLTKADELMSPEKAIEFSAALQRLGVQSSDLLDPLSAMDMAMNDPAALQNEMVKISQQFTRLKADGSGFEILPGAKLQLKEVADKLGMSANELANMSIKSADLEMKMSKIKFPGFAASEEDKQLIANMAQMKDGRAMVTIAKEGGGTEEVDVENLTAEQIDKLKEEQANQNKTAEEIARDQLTVLREIENQIAGQAKSIQLGIASSGTIQRVTDAANILRKTAVTEMGAGITTENTREKLIQPSLGVLEKGVIDAIMKRDMVSLATMLPELGEKVTGSLQGVIGGTIENIQNTLSKSEQGVTGVYQGVSGVKPGETNMFGFVIKELSDLKTNLETNLFGEKTKTSNLNITQEIKVTGDANQMTQEMVETTYKKLWKEFMSDPKLMNEFNTSQTSAANSSGMGN